MALDGFFLAIYWFVGAIVVKNRFCFSNASERFTRNIIEPDRLAFIIGIALPAVVGRTLLPMPAQHCGGNGKLQSRIFLDDQWAAGRFPESVWFLMAIVVIVEAS